MTYLKNIQQQEAAGNRRMEALRTERIQQQRQQETDRERAKEQKLDQQASAHRNECAATYPQRFKNMQDGMAQFAAAKAKLDAECKRIAPHCSRFSSGHSVCTGVPQRDQDAYDSICRDWPNYKIQPEEDEACTDVDPECIEPQASGLFVP